MAGEDKTGQLHIRLTQSQRDALEVLVEDRGASSASELVRELVEREVSRELDRESTTWVTIPMQRDLLEKCRELETISADTVEDFLVSWINNGFNRTLRTAWLTLQSYYKTYPERRSLRGQGCNRASFYEWQRYRRS